MTKHGERAERFRDLLVPAGFAHDLESYLRATDLMSDAQQALMHRAYGAYLAYYAVREELDAALGEIVAHERHHEGDADGK